MRRFLIASPKFEGTIEVLYDNNEELYSFSFAGVELARDWKDKFLERMRKALIIGTLKYAFDGTQVMIVESEYEVTFEMFWHEYPYKRNRHLAEPLFNKMAKPDQIKAWEAAKEYGKYGKRNDWYKYKLADLWLKTKQYLNDWKSL